MGGVDFEQVCQVLLPFLPPMLGLKLTQGVCVVRHVLLVMGTSIQKLACLRELFKGHRGKYPGDEEAMD